LSDGGQVVPLRPEPLAELASIQTLVGDRLVLVEEELDRHLRSEVGIINELGAYLADGGGKRVRPLLLLLGAGMGGYEGPWDVKLAAVFEFIHTATLVHDDIIDEAQTRRGRRAVNHIYGNDLTVLLGDYLYIKAMNMALEAGRIEIIRVLAAVTLKMIEGELMAHHCRGSLDLTPEQHLDIVERKTAYLFSGCCQVAGLLADLPADRLGALSRYGMALGNAFQLVDDVLDFTANESTLGKPVASDLREGRLTLPLIYVLEKGDPEHRRMLATVVRERGFETVPLARILELVHDHGTLDRTRELARQQAEAARSQLEVFEDGPHTRALRALPRLLLDRDR
jgi:octaprenyl-diphosphate synthase